MGWAGVAVARASCDEVVVRGFGRARASAGSSRAEKWEARIVMFVSVCCKDITRSRVSMANDRRLMVVDYRRLEMVTVKKKGRSPGHGKKQEVDNIQVYRQCRRPSEFQRSESTNGTKPIDK